jgi:hypothetical protein
MLNRVTHNGSALCRCGISIPFSQEQKPNKDINDKDNNQKLGYDLLPEPQPNNEPLLIGLSSATLAQNAML